MHFHPKKTLFKKVPDAGRYYKAINVLLFGNFYVDFVCRGNPSKNALLFMHSSSKKHFQFLGADLVCCILPSAQLNGKPSLASGG